MARQQLPLEARRYVPLMRAIATSFDYRRTPGPYAYSVTNSDIPTVRVPLHDGRALEFRSDNLSNSFSAWLVRPEHAPSLLARHSEQPSVYAKRIANICDMYLPLGIGSQIVTTDANTMAWNAVGSLRLRAAADLLSGSVVDIKPSGIVIDEAHRELEVSVADGTIKLMYPSYEVSNNWTLSFSLGPAGGANFSQPQPLVGVAANMSAFNVVSQIESRYQEYLNRPRTKLVPTTRSPRLTKEMKLWLSLIQALDSAQDLNPTIRYRLGNTETPTARIKLAAGTLEITQEILGKYSASVLSDISSAPLELSQKNSATRDVVGRWIAELPAVDRLQLPPSPATTLRSDPYNRMMGNLIERRLLATAELLRRAQPVWSCETTRTSLTLNTFSGRVSVALPCNPSQTTSQTNWVTLAGTASTNKSPKLAVTAAPSDLAAVVAALGQGLAPAFSGTQPSLLGQ